MEKTPDPVLTWNQVAFWYALRLAGVGVLPQTQAENGHTICAAKESESSEPPEERPCGLFQCRPGASSLIAYEPKSSCYKTRMVFFFEVEWGAFVTGKLGRHAVSRPEPGKWRRRI
jgi:hypothetical protein